MDMYHTLICYFDLIMLKGHLSPIKPLKFTKLALYQFAILQKWNQRKRLRLLHFCIKTWPTCCKHLFDLITICSQGFFDFFRPYAYNGFANKIMHGILFASPLCTNEILANLRSKRCFQQVGQVSRREKWYTTFIYQAISRTEIMSV